MNIDKAIEILIAWKETGECLDSESLDKAELLAIEALKEVKASRSEDYIGDTGLLPGETEE